MNKHHYKAPLFPTSSQKARQERKVRYAQGMLMLRGIHHQIASKKAQMLRNEALIDSIAK